MTTLQNNEVAELKKKIRELERMLLKDDLSPLYNRRAISSELQNSIEKIQLHGEHFALLFLDIDHLKPINEKFGHLAGSKLIAMVGMLIKSCLEHSDLGFRYAGDEFVVICSGDAVHAHRLGERIRKLVESFPFEVVTRGGEQQIRLTLSLGLRVIQSNDSVDGVLDAADRAMFEAKRKSRNTLVSAA